MRNQVLFLLISFLYVSIPAFCNQSNSDIKIGSKDTIEKRLKDKTEIDIISDPQLFYNLLNEIPATEYFKHKLSLHNLYQLYFNQDVRNDSLSLLLQRKYADFHYSANNYEDAIEIYKNIITQTNSDYYTTSNLTDDIISLSRSYRNSDKFDQQKTSLINGLKIINDTSYLNICNIKKELGKHYSRIHNYDSARILLIEAEEAYFKSNTSDYKLIADTYKRLSYVELKSGQTKLSSIYSDKALDYLLKSNPSDYTLALYYRSKGLALFFNYNISLAIEYFKMSSRIFEQEKPNSNVLATEYRYIGWAYYILEKYDLALEYFNKSLAINSDISNFFTHRQIADTYFAIDSIDQAKKIYENVLNYLENQEFKDDYQIATTKADFGRLLVEKTDQHEYGEKTLTECIAIYYRIAGVVDVDILYPLNVLGTHYLKTERIEQGLDTLQSSLTFSSKNFSPENIYDLPDYSILNNNNRSTNTLAWKARGLYDLYQKTNNIDDLKASLETYNFYIYCSSENRKYFGQSGSLVTSKQIHYVYNEAINVAYQLYKLTNENVYIDDIFRFTEGKKSYTLFQSLKILENKKLLNIPEKLIQFEEKNKEEINLLSERIEDAKKRNLGQGVIDSLQNLAFILHKKVDSIQSVFKNDYSGFYSLKFGFKELNLHDVATQVPKQTAFINYSISDSLLHGLCFTEDTVVLKTQYIDSVFLNHIQNMSMLSKDVNTDDSYDEFKSLSNSSYYLYQVLVEPYIEFIEEHQIIFIPDDELNYISFDALIQEQPQMDRPDYRKLNYLIKNYKTNVANSMQIYFNMKQRLRNPNDEVFAFAPYYPQFVDENTIPEEYQDLRPLDYAELEVNRIARNINTRTFIGYEATKDTFRKIIKDAGIIHLAMHTKINDEDPLYSKFLFTYESEDESSMLNTFELLALNLNAELAVLSGCSTGDGKLQKGEGVMSLSSGFQYAGVPAIVMSLWEVNDRFGSLVIHKFYENLANGLDKKQSLYNAKLDVMNMGNALYAHPYYWAGLTLIGDDSKIEFIDRYQWDKLVIIFTPIIFIIVVLFQTRKKWLH